jgi:hypothetical protein
MLPEAKVVLDVVKWLGDDKFTKARNLISEMWDVARRGKPTFLIFGIGGTGKSTMGQYLQTFRVDGLPLEYQTSIVTENSKIASHRFSQVIVYPGQKEFFDGEFTRSMGSISELRRPFIIICLAYGYRSIDPMQKAFINAPQGVEARNEEIEFAKSILAKLPLLRLKKYTLITVINKQDLWWDEKNDVDTYYENQYIPLVDKFGNDVGINNLTHSVFPMCLARSNLLNSEGISIKTGASSFDDRLRSGYLTYFLTQLKNFLK